jgi:hypothetical protein
VDQRSPNGTGGSGQTGGSPGVGGGAPGPVDLSKGGPKLRVLTQSEYLGSIKELLGTISAELKLPEDRFPGGYATTGGSEVAINASAVTMYEAASRAATAEVFADAARWPTVVGCQPQADLSDACVTTFITTFGKRAFRRDLAPAEVSKWLAVGQETAQLAASAAPGLAAIVSGLLQSPYFLYRIDVNQLDESIGRLKYNGPSMATRLSYLLTGRPPSDALLSAAAMGQLDTAEGVKTAAAPLLNDPNAVEGMAVFFREFSQTRLVSAVEKSAEMFPSFNPTMRTSMLQAADLFIKDVVLAPGADVRSFFNSDKTYVDATLAPIYGVTAPASGFMQITLGPETKRGGILGQAAVIAGHSQSDHNSPTRRGLFISNAFLCQIPPSPPDGVVTVLPPDPNKTTRQELDLHRTSESCKACHALFDPLGFALENFDSIGQFRTMEDGQPIDATGTLDGAAFDGAAQLGATLAQNPRVMACFMDNFYRAANGVVNTSADSAVIAKLTETMAAKGYIWRDIVAEFVASDAFRSAPAAALTAGNQ